MTNQISLPNNRIVFLDFLRAFACFMVILVHVCEYFYAYDPLMSYSENELFWANLIDSAIRSCVPLFVMTSSYLMMPMKDEPEVFLKKRFTRVLIPFAIWSLLYAILPVFWGGSVEDMQTRLMRLTHNFNSESGHFWYIYMIVGIYLFMPIISPWLKTVKRRHQEIFLGIWFFSTFNHIIKYFTGDEFGLLGQCYWNEYGTLWYFSGFIGYIVLAHYIREYINWSVAKSLVIGIPMWLIGWASSYLVFDAMLPTDSLYEVELTWRFCSPNTVLATFGLFMIFKSIKTKENNVPALIADISKLSYGMYLAHMFLLWATMHYAAPHIENLPLRIFVCAIITYVLSYILVKILSYLPNSKYIVG